MDFMREQIQNAIDLVLKDYRHNREIDKENPYQPEPAAIGHIVSGLRQVVFPGAARGEMAEQMKALVELLSNQIARAMQATGTEDAPRQAKTLVQSFFGRIPAVRALIQTDLQAAYEGDPAATGYDEIIFSYPGLFAVTVYRLAHELQLLSVPMIPRMMTEYAHSLTGIDIHPAAVIGAYFFIDHGTGTVIGETAKIGENVRIYQGVTLGGFSTQGGQSLKGKKRHPTIEDGVTIYAGATILGGETVIGHGSTVGANAFITKSVAGNTTVSVKDQEHWFRRQKDK